MKTFLSLCSFLFIIFINSFPSSTANEPVLDRQQKPLQVGVKYLVVSAIKGSGGGGLTLSKYADRRCNSTVSQESFDIKEGIPVSFHPAHTTKGSVYTSKSLNVKFHYSLSPEPKICPVSPVWKVGRFDPQTRSQLIEIGGMEGKPGCGTYRNWFKIEKVSAFPYYYRFVSDPSDVCIVPIRKYNVSANKGVGGAQWPVGLSFDNTQAFFRAEFIKYEEKENDGIIKQYV